MNHTNLRNLPPPLATAVSANDYLGIKGALSASRLMDSPQIIHLKRQHGLDADVSDLMWALIERALMQVIENSSESAGVFRAAQNMFRAMRKQQLLLKSSNPNDPKIEEYDKAMSTMSEFARTYHSPDKDEWLLKYTIKTDFKFSVMQRRPDGLGSERVEVEKAVYDTIDMYHRPSGVLWIVKICPVSMALKPQYRNRWDTQASIQKYILESNGLTVNKAYALMVFKDFVPDRAKTNINYVSSPTLSVPLNLHDMSDVAKTMKERVLTHKIAEETGVYECTPSDMWKKADEWQVVNYSTNGKRTVRAGGFHSKEMAEGWIRNNFYAAKNAVVEPHEGERTRCDKYCLVSKFCPQHQTYLQEKAARAMAAPPPPKLPDHLLIDEDEKYNINKDDK